MQRSIVAIVFGMLVVVGCQAPTTSQSDRPRERSDAEWAGLFGLSPGDVQRSSEPAPTMSLQTIAPGVTLSLPPQWSVVSVPASSACEFPAQSVMLSRQVLITNTPPTMTKVETDVCGNVIRYTETMTRTMTASPWAPISRSASAAETFKAPGKEQYGTIEFQPQSRDYTITLSAQQGDRLCQVMVRSNVARLDPMVAKNVIESLQLI